MKVVLAKFRAFNATMAVEYRIISNLHLIVEVQKLRNVLVGVFHVLSLSDIADNAIIKPLHYELQSPYPKAVPRLQIILFRFKKHLVEPTRHLCV